jgi:acyl-coenzyme A thioesterase PaaI-like protein
VVPHDRKSLSRFLPRILCALLRLRKHERTRTSNKKFLGRRRIYNTAIPGYVYGGLLASLVDCHGTGTAAAAGYRAENRPMDTEPPLRYLTASLHVDYLKPTPLGPVLEIRAKVKEVKGRKVVIEEWIVVNGVITVRGEVVAVQVPESLVEELLKK